jgi:zinc transport system permease protein
MIQAILNYNFMQNALMAAVMASIVTGIIGTIAIEKKLISMSGGIAHASFGGIGFGYLLGFEPIWGGLAFAVGSSVLISRLSKNAKMKADTLTGILWSFGMALGILFISLAPGYMPDMTSYLFGDILSVSNNSLIYMGVITIIITVAFLMFYHHILIYLFDEEYAKARGVNTRVLEWMVYIMIPVGIIVLIKIVGIILTIALMTIPVSIAKLYSKSIIGVVGLSVLLSMLFSFTGLVVSYYINIPSGVCIILASTLVYLAVLAVAGRMRKKRHTQRVHGEE